MAPRGIPDLSVEGKRVFLRLDLDVPLTPAGGIADDARLRAALPTIQALVDRGARVVLGGHLGEPGGRPDPRLSLEPVAACLVELGVGEIRLPDEVIGDGARKVVADLREGQIAVLENLRFHPGEESNDESFARELAALADVYVGDSLALLELAAASTVGLVRHLGEHGVGLALGRELAALARLAHPEPPFAVVAAGVQTGETARLLDWAAARAQTILCGGALAPALVHASSRPKSGDDEGVAHARGLLKRAKDHGAAVVLPVDLIVTGAAALATALPADAAVTDLGPKSQAAYAAALARARTVLWGGDLGPEGNAACARAVAAHASGFVLGAALGRSLARLGVTLPVLEPASAALTYLEGGSLPGLAVLEP